MFVDNSPNQKSIDVVRELNPDMRIEQIPFAETTRASQANALNYIRDEFLKGDYEYLMMIECDVFPIEDITEHLMANDKDICGTPYLIGGVHNDTKTPCVTTGKYALRGGVPQESFMVWDELDGELKEVGGGIGLGCVLIKRSVLEALEFRWQGMQHADTHFHRDAHRKGFGVWLDTRFMTPHYPSVYPSYY